MRKIALIDADSIVYILGWKFRDSREGYEDIMLKEVDQFMVGIIQATGATHYVGVFSPKHTFRCDIATTKVYKGNRPPSPDWLKFWSPIIKQACINKYGFFEADNIEADDVLSILRNGILPNDVVVLCSPDKDLNQVPGSHYNYSKATFKEVSESESKYNFWYQVLVGDTSDNITGGFCALIY